MLYLVTGGMGAGKTVFTLAWVRALQLSSGRPVVMHRWTDPQDDVRKPRITLKGEGLTFGWVDIEFEDWEKQPDGTIFIIDECHEVLPTRTGPRSTVPPHIQALATHRHRGFDFYLITQHPKNMDAFVRRLIADPGWHRHLKRRNGSSFVAHLEWPAVNERCEKNDSGKTATVSHHKYPAEVFEWYVSTSLDTAKLRIPKQLYIIIAALIAVPLLIYFVVQFLRGPSADAKPAPAAASSPTNLTLMPSIKRDGSDKVPLNAEQYAATLAPRFPDLAYTAPRYDELTTPKRAPYPAACVQRVEHKDDCKCYTQDATPYPIGLDMCKRFAREGVFIDWHDPSAANASALMPSAPASRMSNTAATAKQPELVAYELQQNQALERHMQQIAQRAIEQHASSSRANSPPSDQELNALALRNAGPRLQGTLSNLRP
ncbi:MAG: hypothetical protein KA751_00180 [Comamonas sp.]|nr:hypothetical protein [Comamonas sp.]